MKRTCQTSLKRKGTRKKVKVEKNFINFLLLTLQTFNCIACEFHTTLN